MRWVTNITTPVADILKAFFNISDGDDAKESGKKVAGSVFRRVIYSVADYWLAFLSGVLIIMLKAIGYGFLQMFFVMWAFDVVVAYAFVAVWQRTGKDVTLGEDYRRASDAIFQKSRIIGWMSRLGVVIKATFWDGPEHIVIFFRKEIKTEARMIVVLLILTAMQAAIWTEIYSLGYDSIAGLIEHIMRAVRWYF